MSRTCIFCNNKYQDTLSNWYSKFCCRNCYNNKETKFNENDIVYTYNDYKIKDDGINGVACELAQGKITKIYTLYRPSKNGFYEYCVQLDNGKVVYRFIHQLFTDINECKDYIDKTNIRRSIIRQANTLIKR